MMSKVAVRRDRRPAKVTMRFGASSRGSGSKAASSAQPGRGAGARPRDRPRGPTPGAARPAPRCSLAFWMAAWMRSIGRSSSAGRAGAWGRSDRQGGEPRASARRRESRAACRGCARRRAPPGSPPRSAPARRRSPRFQRRSSDGADVGARWRAAGCRGRGELDRPADRAVQHLHQHDEAEAGAEAADDPGAGDQERFGADRPAGMDRRLDQGEALALRRAPRCARRPGPGRGWPPRRRTGS